MGLLTLTCAHRRTTQHPTAWSLSDARFAITLPFFTMSLHWRRRVLSTVCMSVAACGGGNSTTAPTASTAVTIDPTRIPVGDGKLSTTTPQVGFVYSCTIPNSPNPAGRAPWISADGLTWNSTTKVTVSGSVLWQSSFLAAATTTTFNVTGNGLPAHATGVFPIRATDAAYQYDKNPNPILSVAIAWGLPANPVVAANPSCTPLGAIGVLLSGARLFNALDADGRDAAAHETQDTCDGHPQGMGSYHYHNLSRCVNAGDVVGQHSALTGYVADGFALFGPQGEGGKILTNADLDVCHGHTHSIVINGATTVQYHYHATREYPYTVGCFKGTPTRIQ